MRALRANACRLAFGLLLPVSVAVAQTPLETAFTYQGRLRIGGSPTNGIYDLRFRLYDAMLGGAQLGSAACMDDVAVADGLFTVSLDFGAQFAGQARFLEIAVRAETGLNCGNETGFVTLSPRQPLTATPYALFALNADKLDGLDSSAFLQSIPVPLTLTGTNPFSHIIRGENAATENNSYGVRGEATGASGITYGVYARSLSTSGRGVYGYASATSGTTYGGRFESASTSGRAVYGTATAASGFTYGGYFLSDSTSGTGVYGYASAGSGFAGGGVFQSDSADGYGVFVETTATSGATYGGYFVNASTSGRAVYGLAVATSGATYGGSFQSDSTGGIGVYGRASAGSGSTVGGRFRSDSVAGYGVIADTTATSGTTYGGRFESASTSGRGVYGYASASSGTTYGVYGEGNSPTGYAGYFLGSGGDALYVENSASGRAVRAVSTADTALWALTTSGVAGVDGRNAGATGRGVYGYATAPTGTNYGVYGRTASSSGYGVYALGNMGASGTKSFQIDHPDDPENKYLLHYSAESPEVINFYRGTVALNEHGEAVVELPQYFARINKTPSYQLTAVGAPMPNLHVAEKISDDALGAGATAGPSDAAPICSFRIAGGVPGGEVSWRVEAVRNDLRMRLHGAPVEREKVGPERGKYLHPEYYGQPPEMGIDFQAEGHARCDESRRNEHGTREAGER